MIPQRIQRIFLFFFATVLFAGSAGIYFYGSLNVALHRTNNLKGQSQEETLTLTLSKSDFKSIVWMGDKDFVFEGKLYDIESFSVSNGNYILKCEQDEYESGMIAAIEKQLDNDHGTKTNDRGRQSFFCFEYVIPSTTVSVVNIDQPIVFTDIITAGSVPAFTQLASPPPEA